MFQRCNVWIPVPGLSLQLFILFSALLHRWRVFLHCYPLFERQSWSHAFLEFHTPAICFVTHISRGWDLPDPARTQKDPGGPTCIIVERLLSIVDRRQADHSLKWLRYCPLCANILEFDSVPWVWWKYAKVPCCQIAVRDTLLTCP